MLKTMKIEVEKSNATLLYRVRINGKIHKKPFVSLVEATESAKALRESVRPCLTCRDEFISEGFHNRQCNKCRSLSEDLDYSADTRRRQ